MCTIGLRRSLGVLALILTLVSCATTDGDRPPEAAVSPAQGAFEAAERDRRQAQTVARANAEALTRARQLAEPSRQEHDAARRRQREVYERERREADERAAREADERAARLAEETARREADSRAEVEREKARRQAQEKLRPEALALRLLPAAVADRPGWARDLHDALAGNGIPPSAENLCAVIAVTEQESTFQADPVVPGLARIAWGEIERRRERLNIPRWALDAALDRRSGDGRSYRQRLDRVRTEGELSEIFQDFIDKVPFGESLLSRYNPVTTGGPMQVKVDFAEKHAAATGYRVPQGRSVRDELFTRRGGLFFGAAHLLGYPARYERMLFRFADFNAGRHACRNAAFQAAVQRTSGVALELDGDLVVGDGNGSEPSRTELAVRTLAARMSMSHSEIRRDLALGREADFERTRLHEAVFALADRAAGRPLPRAVMPQILLASPKIRRRMTTQIFASRVEERYRHCLARGVQPG